MLETENFATSRSFDLAPGRPAARCRDGHPSSKGRAGATFWGSRITEMRLIGSKPPSGGRFCLEFETSRRREVLSFRGPGRPRWRSCWRSGRVLTWSAAGRAQGNCQTKNPEKQGRSEEHTSELQSRRDLVCRLLLEKK